MTMPEATGVSLRKHIHIIQQTFPRWNRFHLVRVARELLLDIQALHSNGQLQGDVSLLDALVDESGHAVVINADRLQPTETSTDADNGSHAVASWLFQTLMLGKGDNEQFALPLDEPDTEWHEQSVLSLWYCLPFKLREAFYDTLKLNRHIPLESWLSLLNEYSERLRSSGYEVNLYPIHTRGLATSAGQTTNLNVRDIDPKTDTSLRTIENVFYGNSTGRIGVLELSSKNVKLLVGPAALQQKFDFNDFQRETTQHRPKGAGGLLNNRNEMSVESFRRIVLPTIDFYGHLARGTWPKPWYKPVKEQMVDVRATLQVDRLYVVATAAYRTAVNRKQIVQLIKDKTGLDVCILSKEEEGAATMTAFIHSAKEENRSSLLTCDQVLVIDQGGGSTEVSIFEGNTRDTRCKSSHSINLGTITLENLLQREQSSMRQGLDSVDGLTERRLREYIRSVSPNEASRTYCVAVGTAITSATGRRRTFDYHGMVLTKADLERKIIESEQFLLEQFSSVDELFASLYDKDEKRFHDIVRNSLSMRLGLPVYLRLMNHFDVDELTVSGTALWYGIYFNQATADID